MNHIHIVLILFIIVILFLPSLNYTVPNLEGFTDIELSPRLTTENIKNLKMGQQKMTSILREFDRICRKYGLKYWCTGGTLIGAIRHEGWVPWDADIDVAMLEDDYEKLKNIIRQELPSNLWFQTTETDPYFTSPLTPAKIRDLNSCYLNTIRQSKLSYERWHKGVQLDIFIYQKKGNKLFPKLRAFNDLKVYNYDFIFPLANGKFDDVFIYMPNKYKEYCIKNWGSYPPKLIEVRRRYPHEGVVDPDKTCEFHKNKYKKLYDDLNEMQNNNIDSGDFDDI